MVIIIRGQRQLSSLYKNKGTLTKHDFVDIVFSNSPTDQVMPSNLLRVVLLRNKNPALNVIWLEKVFLSGRHPSPYKQVLKIELDWNQTIRWCESADFVRLSETQTHILKCSKNYFNMSSTWLDIIQFTNGKRSSWESSSMFPPWVKSLTAFLPNENQNQQSVI
jgi:hypothetical protein